MAILDFQTAQLPREGRCYRPGHENICPGCGKTHWLVGRSTAECAYCATALAIRNSIWTEIRVRAA